MQFNAHQLHNQLPNMTRMSYFDAGSIASKLSHEEKQALAEALNYCYELGKEEYQDYINSHRDNRDWADG